MNEFYFVTQKWPTFISESFRDIQWFYQHLVMTGIRRDKHEKLIFKISVISILSL